jgi:MFS transporter, ACS family, glucarate transporter
MLLGDRLTDFTFKLMGPRWGRGLPIAISRIPIALAYVGCIFYPDPFIATIMMCVVAFSTDMGIAPVWAWTQDVGEKHVGSVMGWMNMWGNFGAAIAPLMINHVLSLKYDSIRDSWNVVFWIFALAQIVAMISALLLDSRQKIG